MPPSQELPTQKAIMHVIPMRDVLARTKATAPLPPNEPLPPHMCYPRHHCPVKQCHPEFISVMTMTQCATQSRPVPILLNQATAGMSPIAALPLTMCHPHQLCQNRNATQESDDQQTCATQISYARPFMACHPPTKCSRAKQPLPPTQQLPTQNKGHLHIVTQIMDAHPSKGQKPNVTHRRLAHSEQGPLRACYPVPECPQRTKATSVMLPTVELPTQNKGHS